MPTELGTKASVETPAGAIAFVGQHQTWLAPETAPFPGGSTAIDDFAFEPVKALRIGSMILRLLDEVRSGPLDEAARKRLIEIHERSLRELADSLAPEVAAELRRMWLPFASPTLASTEELRIAQAQLAGWIQGLMYGIQVAIKMQREATLQLLAPWFGSAAFPTSAVIIPGTQLVPERPNYSRR